MVWLQSDEEDQESLWFNRYTQSEGWGVAGVIDSDAKNLTSARLAVDVGDALNHQIKVDPTGVATAVWTQYDGTRINILANRTQ